MISKQLFRIFPRQLNNFSNFKRFLSDDVRSRIQKEIDTSPLTVFMKGTKSAPQCGFSNAVVQILKAQGVGEFNDVNVLADEEIRAGIKEFSEWPTIPQVYVKGEFVGGCDIVLNMHKSGELEELLIKNGIIEVVESKSE